MLSPSAHRIPDGLDRALDASVVLGFSRIGYSLRPLPSVEERMDGKVVVITGATGGIGRAAALGLATLGATVVAVGRRRLALEELAGEVEQSGGRAMIHQADLSLLSDVAELADRLAEQLDRVDVLVNNVGALFPTRTFTPEGIEATIALNLAGPYFLTGRLVPLLAEADGARIVTVTSGGMYTVPLSVSTLRRQARGEEPEAEYRGTIAYARTKRAQVALTEHWAAELGGSGVIAHAMHPGWVDTPGVRGSLPVFRRLIRPILRTPEEGADTVIWLAAAPEATRSSGRLWHDRRPRPTHRLDRTRPRPGELQRLTAWLEELTETTTPAEHHADLL